MHSGLCVNGELPLATLSAGKNLSNYSAVITIGSLGH